MRPFEMHDVVRLRGEPGVPSPAFPPGPDDLGAAGSAGAGQPPSGLAEDSALQQRGLSDLGRVALNPPAERILESELLQSGGHPVWRTRKKVEARELLALAQIAPPGRLSIETLSLREDLRAMVLLRVAVPCRPERDGEVVVAPYALLALRYPPEALFQSLPGFAFVQVLSPPCVWHANVSADPIQALCLGAQLPPGIRVTELILMTYGALSMQTVMIDEADPAGVLNVEAARWWQQNMRLVPLSAAPFLDRELAAGVRASVNERLRGAGVDFGLEGPAS